MTNRLNLIQSFAQTLKQMLATHSDFKGWMEEMGVELTDEQFEKLSKYLQLLKKKNEGLNLTRITEGKEAWIKHILDSLMAAPFFQKPGLKVVDIGTGGGMPGIPLAILFPSAQFTLVDATEKKIKAVQEFVFELNLKNVDCFASRIESFAHLSTHREQYDLVVTRALAPLRTLAELALPLVHPYGKVVAYKGPEYISELGMAQNAIKVLQAEPARIFHYSLPEQMGDRTLIVLTKKTVTDSKYPRRDGVPGKKPL